MKRVLASVFYHRGFRDVELRDTLEFFKMAILHRVVTPNELYVLFHLRLFDTPTEELEEKFETKSEYLELNSIFVRLRLQNFARKWDARK